MGAEDRLRQRSGASPKAADFYRARGSSQHRRVASASDWPPRSQRCRLAFRPKWLIRPWSRRWALERPRPGHGVAYRVCATFKFTRE